MTDDEVFLSKLLNTFATLTKESNSGKHATQNQLIVTDSSIILDFINRVLLCLKWNSIS